jgi:opacity protein-like surface antigen
MSKVSKFRIRALAAIVCALFFASSTLVVRAMADENIGSAAVVRTDLKREQAGASGAIAVGDPVYQDETVRTSADSVAKLVFLDSTNLALGPASRVVLDRFVYDAAKTSQAMAVDLTKGVFRFTTGVLKKDAYMVDTPTAAIGVRGTVLDIAVANETTRVTLREGGALVCPRIKGKTFQELANDCEKPSSGKPCLCVELGAPGQTAKVSRDKGSLRAALARDPVRFGSLCSRDGNLCTASNEGTRFAGGETNAPTGFSWSGFHGGVSGGYSWDGTEVFANAWSRGFGRAGIYGGPIAGYDFQFEKLVLGLETQYNLSNIRGSTSSPSYSIATDVTSFGSTDVRIGFTPTDRILVYGLGGVAYADIKHTINLTGTEQDNFRAFEVGHDLGVGVSYALINHLSLNLEYRRYNFGTENFGPIGALGPHSTHETLASTVLSLNYSFGN